MASSLQALSNAIKNATTREQPAINVKELEEEEEESGKEENQGIALLIESIQVFEFDSIQLEKCWGPFLL
ncbi:hypothetical protein MJO28_008035 [Puccinia striiformis f. sp. tritici]|uniref:Uncharacterized protein n=1 Tax=Puccinia striiformis f. sp. tritici TaxID=168172 RepID=A0ACC0EA94_9BASI|nr:hypothetical protein MJO28_008035 [Puccinia striiformis f. sp. tritici]